MASAVGSMRWQLAAARFTLGGFFCHWCDQAEGTNADAPAVKREAEND
jgi:hypothetical protein